MSYFESERLFDKSYDDNDDDAPVLQVSISDGQGQEIAVSVSEMMITYADTVGALMTSLFVTPEGAPLLLGALISSLTTTFGRAQTHAMLTHALELQGHGPQEVEFDGGEIFGDD